LTGNRLGQTLVPSSIGLMAATVGVSGVMGVTSAALLGAALSVRGAGVDSPAEPREQPEGHPDDQA
ncbi:MAG: MFS transporter, partial [Chloroflexota bacterium]